MPAYTSDSLDTGGRRQTVAAVGIFLLSLVTLFLPPSRQQAVASALRDSVLSPFVSVQKMLTLARSRASDQGVLRRQLDSLVAATSGHSALAAENRRLLDLLGVHERLGPGWIPAGVVRSGTTGSESTFMLDVGSDDGVGQFAPVITADGVLGTVQEVYPKTSLAIDWTHPDFKVSAMDPAGMTFGLAQSRRGEFREEDRLEFNGTAYTSRLEDGTVVISSGLGGVWPLGIPIGKVDGIAEADAGWRKSYWLRPMVELGGLTHVLVGIKADTTANLMAVWPPDSVLTGPEKAVRDQARADSLAALRTILSAPLPLRDSVLAAMLLGSGWTPPAAVGPEGTVDPQTGRAGLAGTGARQGGVGTAAGAGAARGGTGGAAAGGGQPGRPAGPPVVPIPPPRPTPTSPPPAAAPDPRFPRPTDTIRIPARPDTLGPPGRGRGTGPDTTRVWEGGAPPR
jgi:rod shape-determining protein MreC